MMVETGACNTSWTVVYRTEPVVVVKSVLNPLVSIIEVLLLAYHNGINVMMYVKTLLAHV